MKLSCFLVLLTLGCFCIGFAAQRNEKLSLENKLLKQQNELKSKEIELQVKKIKNEALREDIENIRLAGFMRAYSKKEFIIEVIK